MTIEQVTLQGTLQPDGTLVLDEKPSVRPGRVQVTVVPVPDLPTDDPFWQTMNRVWAGQKDRGHVPRSAEAVEAERELVREEWEERMQAIGRIQAEARKARERRG